jgi:hypothetical protein
MYRAEEDLRRSKAFDGYITEARTSGRSDSMIIVTSKLSIPSFPKKVIFCAGRTARGHSVISHRF